MYVCIGKSSKGERREALFRQWDWEETSRILMMKIVIRWRFLALGALCLCGFLLRLYSLNWDQGNNFHPDERQILFQVADLHWPANWAQFLDPTHSPLNPDFFAYGSFPLYLLAFIGFILQLDLTDITSLTLMGRAISALFDSGTILLIAYLGLRLTRDDFPDGPDAWNVALFAAALIVFTPLQLQISHFYTVDTMLVFFVVLTILACVVLVNTEKPMRWAFVAGLGYGLALGTKFSAAPLAVPLLVAAGLRWYRKSDFLRTFSVLVFTASVSLIVFLLVEPYALLDYSNFRDQVIQQSNMARGLFDVPYTRQFAGRISYVYEVQNMVLWGMGVTLGCSALTALLWFIWRTWKRNAGSWLVVLSWILVYGLIIGSFYTKFMRYMMPIYPLLTLMAAAGVLALVRRLQRLEQGSLQRLNRLLPLLRVCLPVIVLVGTIFQGLALLNVYSQPNTRVQASRWIYSHLRPGSVLTYEQWDDSLPVEVDGHDPSMFSQAKTSWGEGLDLYGDDTVQKAQQLAGLLPTLDAITMATDRLDKSIPRLPDRYPLTIRYYQLLFSGQLGFHLAAQFQNHPYLFGIALDDSDADESYSVFDHPTCRIFVRDNPYPYTSDQLFRKLLEGVHLPSLSTMGVVRAS